MSDVRYQTYPWTNPQTGKQAKHSYDGEGSLNYLLYLETVGSNQAPDRSADDAFLSLKMGNWTEGVDPKSDSTSSFGTYVLSCKNFMEGYILPKLATVNRLMSVDWKPFELGLEYGTATVEPVPKSMETSILVKI